ncbi:hypothetical protein ABMA28_011393 [Loxostege sticticalis]|uniref:Endonuclease/exonuclease/phosphatase domain-containing protein n=1 Tax=Loxostege sticticalis TaxID=481309 RepID=A0ABD0S505_LOXSC
MFKSYRCIPEDIHANIPNTNTLKILHVNIRSLNCNFSALETILHRLSAPADIIILSECWLSKCPTLPGITGFTSCNSDYNNQNAGVAAYVRENLIYSYDLVDFNDADCLLLKFSNSMAILGMYRSPSYKDIDRFLGSLDATLKGLNNYQNVAIIGDININPDSYDHSKADLYLDVLASYGMLPTYVFPTRKKSCLDHVILRSRTSTVTIVLDSLFTDHAPVFFSSDLKLNTNNVKRVRKHIDIESCVQQLEMTDFSHVLACDNGDVATDYLIDILSDVVKTNTSVKYIPSRKRIIKPWITLGLLKCLRNRDRLFSKTKKQPENLILQLSYKRYKNFVNNLIKKVKQEYERAEFLKVKGQSKATWELVRKVGNVCRPHNPASKLIPPSGDPFSTANLINQYFANVGKKIALEITSNSDTMSNYYDSNKSEIPAPLSSMALCGTDCREIEAIINGLKNASAAGSDGIPTVLIKASKEILIPILVHIFNLCISSGIFPKAFKKALVSPFYKNGDRGSVSNYRPISVLPVL